MFPKSLCNKHEKYILISLNMIWNISNCTATIKWWRNNDCSRSKSSVIIWLMKLLYLWTGKTIIWPTDRTDYGFRKYSHSKCWPCDNISHVNNNYLISLKGHCHSTTNQMILYCVKGTVHLQMQIISSHKRCLTSMRSRDNGVLKRNFSFHTNVHVWLLLYENKYL